MLSSVFLFLDIGGPELMLILFVALLLFGGDKLPDLARGLGKGIRDFKDASEGVKREITNQIDNYESKKKDDAPANTEETPLIAEHSTDNPDGNEPEDQSAVSHVANTIPVGGSHVAGTDQVIIEEHGTENHEHDSHVSTEPSKTVHE